MRLDAARITAADRLIKNFGGVPGNATLRVLIVIGAIKRTWEPSGLSEPTSDVVEWVAGHILPHEAELRTRLRRLGSEQQEIDDIVQDTYLHIAELPGVAHIRDGRAYLFAAARGVLLKRVRHDRVVRIDQLADRDTLAIADEEPSAERRVQARQELARIAEILRTLPGRCREVFELQRLEELSQREIGARLGITLNMVEYEAAKGLRLIGVALASDPERSPQDRRGLLPAIRRRGRRQP